MLSLDMSMRLPDYCSNLEAELFAIMEGADWLHKSMVAGQSVTIYCGSQAVIRSLQCSGTTLKLVIKYGNLLNKLSTDIALPLSANIRNFVAFTRHLKWFDHLRKSKAFWSKCAGNNSRINSTQLYSAGNCENRQDNVYCPEINIWAQVNTIFMSTIFFL